MRIFIIALLVAFMTISCDNQNDNKVVYFVRHAEKDVVPKDDPALTTDGVIRSVDLAKWFRDIELDTIFSTDYERTRETAVPVAEQQNLQISYYNAADYEAFASQLREMKVDTILVIGHSNTILEQIEALGIERPQKEISENEYDKIFEVAFEPKKAEVHQYGSKSDY